MFDAASHVIFKLSRLSAFITILLRDHIVRMMIACSSVH